jgi:S-DNA-T family DNA segregation ATPase FtsK/SpoIIIE
MNLSFFQYVTNAYRQGILNKNSGGVGSFVGFALMWAFGIVGAKIVSILFVFTSLLILTGKSLTQFFYYIKKSAFLILGKIQKLLSRWYAYLEERRLKKIQDQSSKSEQKLEKSAVMGEDSNTSETWTADTESDMTKEKKAIFDEDKKNEVPPILNVSQEKIEILPINLEDFSSSDYAYPEITLLNESVAPKESDIARELQSVGRQLVETLNSFNVQTKITEICRGPSVTRYELQPAPGVKISRITSLSDDIALNLAASGVRIEAPIPGKSAVGIEIPNKIKSVVNMRELISSAEFITAKSKLTVVIGKGIAGQIIVGDLGKMPHLLIAGSTGSGKSVCINSFIISLLYKAGPDEVKMLMIDPKIVELGVYNGIPHLLVPVVTDPHKAAGALGWAVNEMLMRYKKFAQSNVRDLASYNAFVDKKNEHLADGENVLQKMPQIVIIIDELSDLMMAAPNEIEDYICRLAQMARAAGMYLVIATQRPSVDVITGIIKANIPSRIALAVSSQVDSRTILDISGAEKLLGRGDMMFSPSGVSKPVRVQGCYVTDDEIERVVDAIKEREIKDNCYDENVINQIEENALSEKDEKRTENNDKDPMMNGAIKCVVEAGQASTSLLQRKLRIGYARAGRLIDEMEQLGIIGPYEGSKARQVIITHQQFLERNMMKHD